MIFKIVQKVTHPEIPTGYEKTTHIIGRDLKHAVECVRAPQYVRDELLKKYHCQWMDMGGRTTSIEITEEVKG
jgi:hypothetical protein